MSIEIYKSSVLFFYGEGNSVEARRLSKELTDHGVHVIEAQHEAELFEFTIITDQGSFSGDNARKHLQYALKEDDVSKAL